MRYPYEVAAAALLAGFASVVGLQTETPHLRLVWVEETTEELRRRAGETAEALFHEVVSFVGQGPDGKPMVVLRGEARSGQGGARDYSHVDDDGVIHLFRFTPDVDNYFNAFPHELVHALRIGRKDAADWFFEEGFAEFVRLRIDDGTESFPWFGHPVAVVAAGHLVDGTDIPLQALRSRHAELNQPCRAQAYVLRASFFDWLGTRFGDGRVLAMSREANAGLDAHYLQHFGEQFDALAAAWVDDTVSSHDAGRFRAYRETTPIRFVPLCDAAA